MGIESNYDVEYTQGSAIHNWTIPCGGGGPLPYVDTITKIASVNSWRGPKDSARIHPFGVFKFNMSSDAGMHNWCSDKCSATGDFVHLWYLLRTYSDKPWLFDNTSEFCEAHDTRFAYDGVLADLFGKANSPDFDGAVTLVETLEVVHFIRDCFKQAAKITWKFNDGKFLKDPAEMWIVWRYAIMPILLTVDDAIKAFKGTKAKSKVQAFKEVKLSFNDTCMVSLMGYPIYFDVLTEYKLRNGAGLWIKAQCDPFKFGNGLFDFVRAGWERVPFSFILDWFLDVGAWLDSLRNTELTVEKSYGTRVIDRTTKVWFSGVNSKYYQVTGETSALPLTAHGFKMTRTPNVSPPILPVLNGQTLSLFRAIDATALASKFIAAFLGRKTKGKS